MNLIIACDINNGIGKENKLPWKIKEDLNWSPSVTLEAGIAAAIAYLDKSGQ